MGRLCTRRMKIEDLALAHVCTAPSFLEPPAHKEGASRPRGRPCKSVPEASGRDASRHSGGGGGGGGGGAWRAFVSLNTGYKWSAAGVQELSRQYHTLSREDLDMYRMIGTAGVCRLESCKQKNKDNEQAGRLSRRLLNHPTVCNSRQ
eukprot:82816-Amphidinium_carterae.1